MTTKIADKARYPAPITALTVSMGWPSHPHGPPRGERKLYQAASNTAESQITRLEPTAYLSVNWLADSPPDRQTVPAHRVPG